jgi:hypothetical protein
MYHEALLISLVQAPLPKDWKPCKQRDSEEIYYFNFETAESSWDHPCDGYYKRIYEEEKKKKEINKKAKHILHLELESENILM